MSPPTRLALFVCDTPLPTVLAEHGDYHAIFHRLLVDSHPSQSKDDLILDSYDVVHEMEYPSSDKEYDGIILTGSGEELFGAIRGSPGVE
jgi:hypothetical protein